MDIPEANQYHRSVGGVEPTTSSDSTPTISQPYSVLKRLLSSCSNGNHKQQHQHSQLISNQVESPTDSNQSIDKALDLTLQQPQATQQSSGRNVWPDDDETIIARTMRKYYIQNPDRPRIEMIRALYTSLKPDVDFDSFETRVDNMIITYCSIRSQVDDPNISLTDKDD